MPRFLQTRHPSEFFIQAWRCQANSTTCLIQDDLNWKLIMRFIDLSGAGLPISNTASAVIDIGYGEFVELGVQDRHRLITWVDNIREWYWRFSGLVGRVWVRKLSKSRPSKNTRLNIKGIDCMAIILERVVMVKPCTITLLTEWVPAHVSLQDQFLMLIFSTCSEAFFSLFGFPGKYLRSLGRVAFT